jgi:putative DNA primase/helicase
MITYCLPLAYRPELAGQCPLFCGMVHRMCGGNSAVADYVLRVLGYALIGENPEQLIFFLNGPTKSGKTQVLYIVRQLLGVLAEDSKADLITRMPNGRNARVENSVRGKRLVTINETSESMQIDEGQLKRLTGEPMIAVDKHYADSRIKTAESWAIICGNNEMPSVSSMDSAVRERMVVVPCGDTIPVEQRDQHLAARIIATEGEAILALLVGCASRYFREKLPRPAEVDAATEKYCRDQESVAAFAAEACVIVRPAAGRPVAHVGMAEAYRFYLGWCRDNNKTAPLGPHAFSEKMSAVPGILREDNGGSVRRYSGVSWNEEYLRRRTGVFY